MTSTAASRAPSDPVATPARGPAISESQPTIGPPTGNPPRTTIAESAITRPRIAGAHRCCSKAIAAVTNLVAVNPVAVQLITAKATLGERAMRPLVTAKAMTATTRQRTEIWSRRATDRAPATEPTPMAV